MHRGRVRCDRLSTELMDGFEGCGVKGAEGCEVESLQSAGAGS